MRTKIQNILLTLRDGRHSFRGAVCAGAVMLIASSAPAQNRFVDDHRGRDFRRMPPFDSGLGQNLFVADSGSGNIYEFTPDGVRSTFASGLYNTATLAFNCTGDLFVADVSYDAIYEFTPDGVKSIFASGLPGVNEPWGLAFNRAGDLFEADVLSGNIYKFTPERAKSTFASGLAAPTALAFDRAGNLFLADVGSGNIYKFTPGGVKSIFASGLYTFSGMAFNGMGDLFVADELSDNIYEFTPDGTQFVFASGLAAPTALAFDRAGNLFVSERFLTPKDADEIVKITPVGVQSIFASGLSSPDGLAFAPGSVQAQSVYIGNPALPFVNYAAPDGVPPLVIMGEYSPAEPLPITTQPLPNGIVQDVKFYGQNYDFTLYALSHVSHCSNTNEQTFRVVAAQHFSRTSLTPGTITLAVTNFCVKAGDFLAFAGIGPYYPQQPNDAPGTDATYEDSSQPVGYDNDTATPPLRGEQFTVGINRDSSARYGYIADNFGNQGRIYAIGVDVLLTDERHLPRRFHDHDDHEGSNHQPPGRDWELGPGDHGTGDSGPLR
jgi:hypothetical protein